MKKTNILLLIPLLAVFTVNAQVKDISVTISPAAEYTWWDNQAGISDGTFIGGKVGFGFGEYMELSGVYLQSHDLKTNFENFGLANYDKIVFNPHDVNVTRWGGEFKANIGARGVKPYITLGTGIQSIDFNGADKFDQIYASAGLGVKLNLAKRVVFLVEAKNTMYNFDAGTNLLTSADKAAMGVTNSDFNTERTSNWSVQGALQFYLGGREPGTMTELDKAYLNQFSGGLRGIQLIIEPGASYIDFHDNSLFRDTWMVGGYVGLDFNQYVGIRGFYFNAVESMKLSTDFDKLSMYGVEFRARLNDGAGVTPYITLGGGYLNPQNNYLGKNGVSLKGGEFATGGLGLNIPLGKRVLINGGAKAMVTSSKSAVDISAPDDLQTHLMYNVGIKFTLGRKSKSTEVIYNKSLTREVDARMAENDAKVQRMKAEFQDNISELENELKLAYEANDVDKAVEIIEEKNEMQKSLVEVEKLEKAQKVKLAVTPVQEERVIKTNSNIQLTPAEFESLVVKILMATHEKSPKEVAPAFHGTIDSSVIQDQQLESLNKRMELLEKLLIDINAQKGAGVQIVPIPSAQDDKEIVSDFSNRILDELKDLNRKIERNSDKIDNEINRSQTIVVTPAESSGTDTNITAFDEQGRIISNKNIVAVQTGSDRMMYYKYSSAMLGFNFGGATTMNLGARLHFDIVNSPFEFMPEIYYGLGKINSFGVSGNIVYPIPLKNEIVLPYVGLGLGLGRIDKNMRGNYNVILGANLPFISENLSVDYTMRNSFDYNQISILYRLPF